MERPKLIQLKKLLVNEIDQLQDHIDKVDEKLYRELRAEGFHSYLHLRQDYYKRWLKVVKQLLAGEPVQSYPRW